MPARSPSSKKIKGGCTLLVMVAAGLGGCAQGSRSPALRTPMNVQHQPKPALDNATLAKSEGDPAEWSLGTPQWIDRPTQQADATSTQRRPIVQTAAVQSTGLSSSRRPAALSLVDQERQALANSRQEIAARIAELEQQSALIEQAIAEMNGTTEDATPEPSKPSNWTFRNWIAKWKPRAKPAESHVAQAPENEGTENEEQPRSPILGRLAANDRLNLSRFPLDFKRSNAPSEGKTAQGTQNPFDTRGEATSNSQVRFASRPAGDLVVTPAHGPGETIRLAMSAEAAMHDRSVRRGETRPAQDDGDQMRRSIPTNADAVRTVASWSAASYAEIRNYRAEILHKRGSAAAEKVFLHFRKEPHAVYIGWDANPSRGRQWLFVAGANQGQMVAYEPVPIGRLKLSVDVNETNSQGTRPISEWGLGVVIARFEQQVAEMAAGRGHVEYFGLVERSESSTRLHQVVAHSVDGNRHFHYFFAANNLLPVMTQVVDAQGQILESECYERLDVNVTALEGSTSFDADSLFGG